MEQKFFIIQVTIRVRQTHPDERVRLTEGGYAHGIAVAETADDAASKMKNHLNDQHWDVLDVKICQPTDPELAIGYPHLERMVAKAMRYGIGAEIVPAAFLSDPGRAN
jgi:hypothetical protein